MALAAFRILAACALFTVALASLGTTARRTKVGFTTGRATSSIADGDIMDDAGGKKSTATTVNTTTGNTTDVSALAWNSTTPAPLDNSTTLAPLANTTGESTTATTTAAGANTTATTTAVVANATTVEPTMNTATTTTESTSNGTATETCILPATYNDDSICSEPLPQMPGGRLQLSGQGATCMQRCPVGQEALGKKVCISGKMYFSSTCANSTESISVPMIVGLLQLSGTNCTAPSQRGMTLLNAAAFALGAALPGKIHVDVLAVNDASKEEAGASRRLISSSVQLVFKVAILDDSPYAQDGIANVLSDTSSVSDVRNGTFVKTMKEYGFEGVERVKVLSQHVIDMHVASANLLDWCKNLWPFGDGPCGEAVAATSTGEKHNGEGRNNNADFGNGSSHTAPLFVAILCVVLFLPVACCIYMYVRHHKDISRPFVRADSDYFSGPRSVLGKPSANVLREP